MRAAVDGIAPTMKYVGDPAPMTATMRRMVIAPRMVMTIGRIPPRRTGLGASGYCMGGVLTSTCYGLASPGDQRRTRRQARCRCYHVPCLGDFWRIDLPSFPRAGALPFRGGRSHPAYPHSRPASGSVCSPGRGCCAQPGAHWFRTVVGAAGDEHLPGGRGVSGHLGDVARSRCRLLLPVLGDPAS